MEGWIKLHRKLLDWEWYSDINVMRLFVHLTLKANHKDKNWRGKNIKKGSFITSLEHLSKETGLSVQNIRTSINKLKSTNEITIKSTSKNTCISLTNWDLYQEKENTNKQTNKQTNKPLTSEQQTTNKPLTTTNNDNNTKNEKNEKNSKEKRGIVFPFETENFKNHWSLWKQYKKEEHGFRYKSLISEQGSLKKLSELSDAQEENAIKIINESIGNGHKGLFPLKPQEQNGNKKGKYVGVSDEYAERLFKSLQS